MVTFSGPNSVIPNQIPSPSPISKEESSAIQSGNSLAATRRSFKDPKHLSLERLGHHFLIRTILGEILRGYQYFQSFSRHQVLRIPSTPQLVHTDSNKAICMALAQLGQFIFHYGNSVTQFNSQDDQNCIGPIQKIQPDDSPSRISLSAYHKYWPPFIPWGIFPQLINILDLFLSLFSFTLLN
ncbi:hypothetical protein O181_106151 [Austropuccinia psidii MF-1]|uniref:Uncharacterized protein n=1 Tax=Austropuccinia psidii MF-1 TaxID=1389203 RepID=A0A9Q3PMZ7_9BASI|nr:hypothetical protein [Austropuccinia psidii MF-1]